MRTIIIVIAGNATQFKEFVNRCISPEEKKRDYIYASDFYSLAGIEAHSIITVGTAREREDFRKIEQLALSRIR